MRASAGAARLRTNLAQVHAEIAAAAGGRPVTLVCVTKYARPEWCGWLLEAGAGHLGENLLPAAAERFDALTTQGHTFIRHLIGAQQSRKLDQIPGHFDWLQALDRLDSAVRLNGRLAGQERNLNVLLQVNIGSELQKKGFAVAELQPAVDQLSSDCPQLRLRGLMAIPPGPSAYATAAEFEQGSRTHFGQIMDLFGKIRAGAPESGSFDTISLGMSQDFHWALQAGSNMVRIGSALFAGLEG